MTPRVEFNLGPLIKTDPHNMERNCMGDNEVFRGLESLEEKKRRKKNTDILVYLTP